MPNPFRRLFGTAGQAAASRAAEDRLGRLAADERRRRSAEAEGNRLFAQDLESEVRSAAQAEEQAMEDGLREVEIPAQELSPPEAWAYSGEWYSGFQSSNVAAMLYEHEDDRLLIEYLDGSFYAYHPVAMPTAIAFYQASSKGTWVWDNLRVRGTVFGYQVPYELISGASAARREWMRTEETRRKHGQIPPSGRDWSGGTIRPRDFDRFR